ncbi:MAG: fumarylacetoacetase [Rubrivivax sp.]|nr:fumarylacetoacetase [Rubrivivax sp.]
MTATNGLPNPDLVDATHDPDRRSWVESANMPDADFPIQNLPLGRFRRKARGNGGVAEPWRAGVAIGYYILDLKLAAAQCPWPEDVQSALEPLAEGDLAAFMAMGRPAWKRLRAALSEALTMDSDQGPFLELCLCPMADAEMSLPCRIGDYTDFYAGIHHAEAVGKLMRPDNPLLPNYKWVPIGYHGRASSIGLGGPVKRPQGQTRSSAVDAGGPPHFGPSQSLDYELELGLWVGVGNELGTPVDITKAEDHLFGISLLNDWSARDIQGWEYQPLGPFLAKNFATSVSPWIVSMDALAPYRRPAVRMATEPQPLPYLDSPFNRAHGAVDIHLGVFLQTAKMRKARMQPVQLSHSNALDAWWTPAQLLAHHTSNGCNLCTGDLLGTGTLSGPGPGQGGSLLELSAGGKQVIELPNGETRSFLQDGDTVILRAFCETPGAARIGFGEVVGTIVG